MHDAGAGCLGDCLRAVGAAIVGNQHLALDAAAGEKAACFGNTGRQCLRFVKTGHKNSSSHASLIKRSVRIRDYTKSCGNLDWLLVLLRQKLNEDPAHAMISGKSS